MVVTSGDAQERIRTALRAELHRNFGRIGEIEQGLDRAEGYLSKFCRGGISMPIDVLLKSLELLGVEPGRFFSCALGVPMESSVYLREVMTAEPEKGLARLHKVAAEIALGLEKVDSSKPEGPVLEELSQAASHEAEELADAMMACSGIEQRRRLRTAKRYRSVAFVRAYLRRLMQASYSDPKMAAKHAEIVGAELVPKLEEASRFVRLELVLRSILLWAFPRRLTNAFTQAAAAVHFALSLSTAYRLDALTGELLRLGAYVLADFGQYRASLQLLGEALVIFDELDSPSEVAKVQVQRGSTFILLDDQLSAVRVLRTALRRLPIDQPGMKIYRLAAFQHLARAYELSGNLEEAGKWLFRALEVFSDGPSINRAKLGWQVARLAQLRGDLAAAEEHLREALELLIHYEAAECTLVAIDLTRVLLERKKPREAVALAHGMAHLIRASRSGPIDQAALVEFIRAAVEGELTLAFVDRLEKGIKERLRLGSSRRPS